MFESEKIARRNLLQYAESIGGKQMYMKMSKALRDARLHTEESLNRKQIDAVVDKLSKQEDFSMDKMKFKKLISEKERRRQAYVKMAIESETNELYGTPSEVGGIGGFSGSQRYDFRKMPAQSKGVSHSVGSRPISSIARIEKGKNNSQLPSGQKGFAPKSSALEHGPVSSISRIKR